MRSLLLLRRPHIVRTWFSNPPGLFTTELTWFWRYLIQADGVLPTADSFAALLGACAARADADQAFKLWRYMWENGIEPNDTCYDYLIKVRSPWVQTFR
jgi:pentatricopeptide repeat protein